MFVDQSDAASIQAAVDAGVSTYVVDGMRKTHSANPRRHRQPFPRSPAYRMSWPRRKRPSKSASLSSAPREF